MAKALILPWSGGMDSTTLLIQNLIDAKYDHIYTLYIDLGGNHEKSRCERAAIKKISKLIEDAGIWNEQSEMEWTHSYYDFHDFPLINSADGLVQPYVWLTYAAMQASAASISHDDISVNVGYVRGDTVLQYTEEIQKMWDSISRVINVIKQPPPLSFPFSGMSKFNIHNRLKKYSVQYRQQFLDTCWVCEMPEQVTTKNLNGFKRCGDCTPCNRDPRFKKK